MIQCKLFPNQQTDLCVSDSSKSCPFFFFLVRKQRIKGIELFLASYVFISDISIKPACHHCDRGIDACRIHNLCTVHTYCSFVQGFTVHRTKLPSYSHTFSEVLLLKKKKKKDFE